MDDKKQLTTKAGGKGTAAHEKRKAHIARMTEFGLTVNDLNQLKAALVALTDHHEAILNAMPACIPLTEMPMVGRLDAVRRAIAFLVDG